MIKGRYNILEKLGNYQRAKIVPNDEHKHAKIVLDAKIA